MDKALVLFLFLPDPLPPAKHMSDNASCRRGKPKPSGEDFEGEIAADTRHPHPHHAPLVHRHTLLQHPCSLPPVRRGLVSRLHVELLPNWCPSKAVAARQRLRCRDAFRPSY